MKIDLVLNIHRFTELHALVHPDKGRSPRLITVPRKLLVDLLIDHGKLHNACENSGVDIND